MSQMLRIRNVDFGRVAILDLAGPLTEHAHSGSHLQFWLGGDFTSVNVSDNIVPLDNNHAVAINSWEPHTIVDEVQTVRSLYLLFYLDTDWVINRCTTLGVSSGFTSPSLEITDELRLLVREFAEGLTSENFDFDVEHYIGDVFDASVLTMQRDDIDELWLGKNRAFTDFRIRKAVQFMHQNLDMRISFDDVARASGISRPHFFHLFRKHMDMTPSMFWNTIRMEKAIQKLVTTDTSLTDLSYSLGFTEPGNFSRFFRSHSGVCPSQYRLVAG